MIRDQIERMKRRYNGDNDIIPGAPVVTWSDRELLDMIERLLARVEKLESGNTLPDSIKEALNSGDGTYRP